MSPPPDDDTDVTEALRTLILTAYADGLAVEDTWTIESVPDEIPDWSVTISKADLDAAEADVDVDVKLD